MTVPLDNLPCFSNAVTLWCVLIVTCTLCKFHAFTVVVKHLSIRALTSGYAFLLARAISYLHIPAVGAAGGTAFSVHGATGSCALSERVCKQKF